MLKKLWQDARVKTLEADVNVLNAKLRDANEKVDRLTRELNDEKNAHRLAQLQIEGISPSAAGVGCASALAGGAADNSPLLGSVHLLGAVICCRLFHLVHPSQAQQGR